MKLNLAKSPILVLLVVAGLAAGTALVSGFAEKANDNAQVTSESPCDGCPLKGADECCKAGTGSACEGKDCASACEKETCKGRAGGCCREKTDKATCTASGCCSQSKPACGTGGCTIVR